MEWLTDKDDATCNKETSHNMNIRLFDRKPLTWIRLVVKTGESLKIPEGTKECKWAGWFGDKCQYRCHCTDDVDCDKVTGLCSSGCGPGWFGPSCQYALHRDLQITYGNYRADDGTCAGGFVTNGDDGVLDISCVTDTPIVKLELSGPGVGSLCSLHISGGRNLALKQTAWQTSTQDSANGSLTGVANSNSDRFWSADNAVDGRLDIPDNHTDQALTCSQTENTADSKWLVKFSMPVQILRTLIYNRRNPSNKDCCESHLDEFSITFLDIKAKRIHNRVRVKFRTALDVYEYVPTTMSETASSGISVKAGGSNSLTLCEVQVFGELQCPSGKFGLLCERSCNCAQGRECFQATGGCPSGCAPGFTGEDCHTKTLSNPSALSAVDEFVPGHPLVLNCNPGIVGLPPHLPHVQRLHILKRHRGAGDFIKIVDFYPYHALGMKKCINNPQEQDWRFQFSTWQESSPAPVNIKWTLAEANLSDAAVYYCNITYFKHNKLQTHSGQQEIKASTETIRAARYCQTLGKLREAIRRKRQGQLTNGVILQHDNATPHTTRVTQSWLEKYGWEILPHPPYSPGLAPSDYHLFGPLKRELAGKRFDDDEELVDHVRKWSQNLDGSFFREGIYSMMRRWQKCVDRLRCYVEK
ncbi:histone-lysine N-methyltransferase SETMAR [Elysia marginata]|uniref:Histone-lysine N-methyltransferase SETMAR n=1 Tax=Elysia marginata TaxID=1093978 RepID=A0AAV4H418_9GAST|nr:histone-lysine N-methyltransferase SETMAR [Elysia marginata]